MIDIHPLALLVPEMSPDQYADLRDDIAENGLLEDIVLYEGMVLDGRHRLRACIDTVVEPRFREFDSTASPAQFVLSRNIKRRHLTESQRATVAVEFLPALEEEARQRQQIAGASHGRGMSADSSGSTEPELSSGRAREEAGALVGVSGATVDRAKRVKREDPDMYKQIQEGNLKVRTADTILRERRASHVDDRPAASAPSPDDWTERQRNIAHKQHARVVQLISGLAGWAEGIDHIDVNRVRAVMEPAELNEWTKSLSKSLARLRRFGTDLQKGRQ